MAKVPDGVEPAALMVAARSVLLDALAALEPHLEAFVLVGAQAVYLHTAHLDLGVAPATADGDLAVDPQRLGPDPRLEQAMQDAGFFLDISGNQPGLWWRSVTLAGREVPVEVDLLAADSFAGRGRRSAKLPPHAKMAVRRVAGLEVAAVDNMPLLVQALDPTDPRSCTVKVAGVVALMVAKAYKIHDRLRDAGERPSRLSDKDAGDVLRLCLDADPYEIADRFAELRTDERVGAVAQQGLDHLVAQFGRARADGVTMAVRALAGALDEARVREILPGFVRVLTT